MVEDTPTRDELLRENRRLRALLEAEGDDSPEIEASGDAGEQRQAEPLREAALFREAFHLGPAALAVMRFSDDAFVEVNAEFCRLTGYDYEDLMGRSARKLGLWPSERLRRVAHERLRNHGELVDVEFSLHPRSGGVRSMLGSCRRIEISGEECLLLSCIDVTERRHAEASQRESEELFRRLFRLSPAGLSLSRLRDGHVTDANPEFCRLTGYEHEELVGRTSADLYLLEDPERRAHLVERLQSEGVVHDFELTIIAADEWPVPLLGSFQLMEIGGEPMILSVLSDMTARKRTEESLRQAKQDAERARAEAEDLAQFRSSVIANITHEVRTPLTVILGFTSILREGVSGPHRRFVDLIERSGRRLLMTLDSVLDLAQLESGTLDADVRSQNVLDIVDSVASTTRSFAEEKGLAFEARLPEDALYAEVDYELLSRALGHLVDNAVKFTDEGHVALKVHDRDGHVLIDVEDTGIGIKEEFIDDLFEVFSQESSGMDRDYQGSGIGLAVTARLVESFGGEVSVESRKGAGSTFTVSLPKVDRAEAQTQNGTSGSAGEPAASASVA